MTVRSEAWSLFDAVTGSAQLRGANPWRRSTPDARPTSVEQIGTQAAVYEPDFETLTRLLGVPILLDAPSQSGVPALALDVWVAYEFRRAGFDSDAVWPRPVSPRVLSPDIASLLTALPADLRTAVTRRLGTSGMGRAASSSANLLGKNYVKQVDVGMSSWRTGPELLVSTKRMDSSFAKNAANRVEESYGDAKNLRLRHPRAALGFVYGLRSTALTLEPDKTEWLIDLLIKLGREDDAYDAVALVIPEWGGVATETADPTAEAPAEDAFVAAGVAEVPPVDGEPDGGDQAAEVVEAPVLPGAFDDRLEGLPSVRLRHEAVPYELSPSRFFDVMIRRVLDNCPVNFHREARHRLAAASRTE